MKYIGYKEGAIHLLFWTFIFTSINVNWSATWFDPSIRPRWPVPLSMVFLPIVFYVNALWLIPQYISKGRIFRYAIWAIVLFLLPELLRAFLYTNLASFSEQYNHSFAQELSSRDSFLLGVPSAVGYGLFLSFLYRLTKDWFINAVLIEKLKSDKSKSDLEALRNQVNPHFLFNSLNTLDQLIDIDTSRAKKYLNKLAHLYRYILQTGQEDLVPLEKEWQFLDDYQFLIQQRFGSAYVLIKNPEAVIPGTFLIPPATLQLLVENAVKHNKAHENDPLEILINLNSDFISVKNRIQKKAGVQEGFGSGLRNLNSKYRLLMEKEISISQDDFYEVTVPLISVDKSHT